MGNQLKHFTLEDGHDRIIEAVAEDGGVIVEKFIADSLVEKIRTQLAEYEKAFSPGISESYLKTMFAGTQTKRFTGLVAKAPAFAEVIDHHFLHEWIGGVFQNDYWINTGQAMVVGPGSDDQFLHRDSGNWPIIYKMGADAPEVMLSVMLAISDFTAENGATRVVPGSHKWADWFAGAAPESVMQAVMPAGSALLYSGKTLHGAGANRTSDNWRLGIHLSFVLGQLTPEEALPLTIPWEIAKDLPERVKAMLGYYSIKTFDGDWPILWLKDYRELRDQLTPAPSEHFISAGSHNRLRQPLR